MDYTIAPSVLHALPLSYWRLDRMCMCMVWYGMKGMMRDLLDFGFGFGYVRSNLVKPDIQECESVIDPELQEYRKENIAKIPTNQSKK